MFVQSSSRLLFYIYAQSNDFLLSVPNQFTNSIVTEIFMLKGMLRAPLRDRWANWAGHIFRYPVVMITSQLCAPRAPPSLPAPRPAPRSPSAGTLSAPLPRFAPVVRLTLWTVHSLSMLIRVDSEDRPGRQNQRHSFLSPTEQGISTQLWTNSTFSTAKRRIVLESFHTWGFSWCI